MNQLKKLLFIVVLLVMGCIHIGAQDTVPGIIVELSSGKKVEIRLADNPKIVFDGQTIKLTADGINVEYTPTEFVKLTTGEVQNNASGITELTSHQESITAKDGYVCLNGFKVSGQNGNSIFLPAAGKKVVYEGGKNEYLNYWTSSFFSNNFAYHLMYYGGSMYCDTENKYDGIAIRPVTNNLNASENK